MVMACQLFDVHRKFGDSYFLIPNGTLGHLRLIIEYYYFTYINIVSIAVSQENSVAILG